MFYKGAN